MFLGIAFSKQVLSFKETDLEDAKTLSDYDIQKESTIGLRFFGQIELYVKTDTGKTTSYIVKASDTVKSLKAKIEDKQGKIRIFNIFNEFKTTYFVEKNILKLTYL